MAVLPIVIAPDPRLKEVSEEVKEVNDDILKLVNDMIDTMYAMDGVGLAAIQVGVKKRIIVMDTECEDPTNLDKRNPKVIINPEILSVSEEKSSSKEGCLSYPGNYPEISRAKTIKVKYRDLNWNEVIVEASGLLATCFQHEMDHLNGILGIDYIPKIKRNLIIEKLRKLKR